jgi:hypothetical protein
MPTHNTVPTTCTASQLTGWAISNLKNDDPKLQVNARLGAVRDLAKAGFKRDFAMLFAITTQKQIDTYGLDEFMPKCGFTLAFRGQKAKGSDQRHQETGDLTMWTTSPDAYEAALTAYEKELSDLKDKIDPPKKPDPKRLALPDLLLSSLRKANMVQNNTAVDNPLNQVMIVSEETLYRHIKMKFGIDMRAWNNFGDKWTQLSVRQLKSEQQRWKNELI